MVSDIKQVLDDSGIRVAGWIVTGVIVAAGAAYLYIKFLEAKKLKVDYMVSQYVLQEKKKANPDFTPEKSFLKKII